MPMLVVVAIYFNLVDGFLIYLKGWLRFVKIYYANIELVALKIESVMLNCGWIWLDEGEYKKVPFKCPFKRAFWLNGLAGNPAD